MRCFQRNPAKAGRSGPLECPRNRPFWSGFVVASAKTLPLQTGLRAGFRALRPPEEASRLATAKADGSRSLLLPPPRLWPQWAKSPRNLVLKSSASSG